MQIALKYADEFKKIISVTYSNKPDSNYRASPFLA